MTSEQPAALLRQQDRDRAGEAWVMTERESDLMAENYYHEETEAMTGDDREYWERRGQAEAVAERQVDLDEMKAQILDLKRAVRFLLQCRQYQMQREEQQDAASEARSYFDQLDD